MIKASELRIGNFIQGNGNDFEIVTWRVFQMFEEEQAEFVPIPLTDEWIVNLGIKEDHLIGYEFVGNTDLLPCVEDDGTFYKLYDENEFPISESIKYVHQLQNLYFALTGEELILKQ